MKNKKLKNDIWLGCILLAVALIIWLVMKLFVNIQPGQVVITVNGEHFGSYDINMNTRVEVGDHNTVIIENGRVWMEYANCPDGLCINQGKIAESGQTIICLPNKVMVTIEGEDGELDAVVQ